MVSSKATEKEVLLTTVIRYGYLVKNRTSLISKDTRSAANIENRVGCNEIVADKIHQAFLNVTKSFFLNVTKSFFADMQSSSVELSTSALTYSTAAKLRQPSLRQDDEIMGAASEVLSFNYRLSIPRASTSDASKKWKDYIISNHLFEDTQSLLDTEAESDQVQIRLHAMDALLPRSYKFYAERGCSQRSYRYLLPMRWLNFEINDKDETNRLIEWVRDLSVTSMSERIHQPRGVNSVAPSSIAKLKQTLKALESRTVPNRKVRRQEASASAADGDVVDSKSDIFVTNTGPIRLLLSPGRYGQLWRKERRCWSNFCHPELRGLSASPSYDATWRTIDKAIIVGFLNHTDKGANNGIESLYAVVEFRGDGFILGQIPRLISTVIAMANGWLPDNFLEVATRPDVYIAAPPMFPFTDKMLYFHSPRYHFHELTARSGDGSTDFNSQTFDSCIDASIEYVWENNLRNELSLQSSSIGTSEEADWLSELRDTISSSIKREMDVVSKNMAEFTLNQTDHNESDLHMLDTDAPAGAYSDTLELLRKVVQTKQWPATSQARSRVIMKPSGSTDKILATKKGSVTTAFPGNAQSSGSFTVINMDLWSEDSGVPLPAANSQFPELARSVFDLEREIIKSQTPLPMADGMSRDRPISRPPSTHCAVNRVSLKRI